MRRWTYIYIIIGYILLLAPLLSLGEPTIDLVIKAQQALKTYGIDPGPIDGIMGPRTRTAIKIYQAENKLHETGILDTETQEGLGIAVRYQPSYAKKLNAIAPSSEIESMETYSEDSSPISSEISQTTASIQDEIPVEEGDKAAEQKRPVIKSTASKISSEEVKGVEYHLSFSAAAKITVLLGLSFVALRPVGWVVLTGISLMASVLMNHLIGAYLNSIAYIVFVSVYVTPALFRLIFKSWDTALVFALLLGIPVLLVSRYAFGSSWLISACNGFAVITLLPLAYRRMFSKRRYRLPYGTLYYRF